MIRWLSFLTRRSGPQVRNISPAGIKPYYEACGPAITRHFKLSDQIRAAAKKPDPAKAEELALEMISIAPEVVAAEKEAAKRNRQKFPPLAHVGFDELSSILYLRKDWQGVIDLEARARREGWKTAGMANRVESARKKLSK